MKTICKLFEIYGRRGDCATCPYDCETNWNEIVESEVCDE